MKRRESAIARDDAAVVVGERRVLDELEIPVLGMVEIREATVDEGADEIERQRGALVTAQQKLRIEGAIVGGEGRAVDQVAAIGRKRHSTLLFEVGGARLGILAREASDPDDRALRAVHQHEAHLEEDLELVGDDRGGAVGEALGAISALQEERPSLGGVGELAFQRFDLPRGDQRRQLRELAADLLDLGGVRVDRLLLGREAPPGVGGPAGHGRLSSLNRRQRHAGDRRAGNGRTGGARARAPPRARRRPRVPPGPPR